MLYDIQPFLSYVRTEFLYDENKDRPYFVDAVVFAIDVSEKQPVRFSAMVNGESVFTDIPVCAIANSKEAPVLDEDDCVYEACSSSDAQVLTHEYLTTVNACEVFSKDGELWQDGSYVLTIAFASKGQLHLVEMSDGNYVCVGNESLKWKVSNEE